MYRQAPGACVYPLHEPVGVPLFCLFLDRIACGACGACIFLYLYGIYYILLVV